MTPSGSSRAGLVLGASFLILAAFVAWNRVFQVDEAQNVYGLWLLGSHKFSAYDFYAPPHLFLLRPLLWFADTAPALYLSVRMAWLAAFAALGWLLLRASGIRPGEPLFTPAVAALASPASHVVANAPLPPTRPYDLGMPRKTAQAFIAPPKSEPRLAALMPPSRPLRGSLAQD